MNQTTKPQKTENEQNSNSTVQRQSYWGGRYVYRKGMCHSHGEGAPSIG